jgi:hypothetical protein
MMSAVRVIAVAAMLWSASVTAQTTEATTTALPTYDANYPPTATEEVEARNTTQYAHGSRYQFTIHIEASEPTTIGLPKTLYRR